LYSYDDEAANAIADAWTAKLIKFPPRELLRSSDDLNNLRSGLSKRAQDLWDRMIEEVLALHDGKRVGIFQDYISCQFPSMFAFSHYSSLSFSFFSFSLIFVYTYVFDIKYSLYFRRLLPFSHLFFELPRSHETYSISYPFPTEWNKEGSAHDKYKS